MRITETPIEGCFDVDVEWFADERGRFGRAYDVDVFAERGLVCHVSQSNISVTREPGTVRGMHLQRPPSAESKFVLCVAGRVFDVAVDMRTNSPTYTSWHGRVLDPDGHQALFIPRGCAHGYMALEPDSVVVYMTSHPYDPEREWGIRPDDPAIGIDWPRPVTRMSEKDRSWPLIIR